LVPSGCIFGWPAGYPAGAGGRTTELRELGRVPHQRTTKKVGAVDRAIDAGAHHDDPARRPEQVAVPRKHPVRKLHVLGDAGLGLVAVAEMVDAGHAAAEEKIRAHDLQHVGTELRPELGERAVGGGALPHVVNHEVRLHVREPARAVARHELREHRRVPGRRRLVRLRVLLRPVRRLRLVVRRRRDRRAVVAVARGQQREACAQRDRTGPRAPHAATCAR
jgi:hypothetical protein